MRDQQRVADHVQPAHHRVEHARRDHVARALQKARGQRIELRKRQHQRKGQKIRARVRADLRAAAEPVGELPADAEPQQRQQRRQRQGRRQPVPDDGPGLGVLASADAVRDLHGKARGHRGRHTAEQPRARGHEADGRRGVRAQRADHGRVDILHGDRRDLRQNGGQTQLPDQPELRRECLPGLFRHDFLQKTARESPGRQIKNDTRPGRVSLQLWITDQNRFRTSVRTMNTPPTHLVARASLASRPLFLFLPR